PAVVLSVLPAGAMLSMLRRGAPLIPATSLALGALAAAAMANFGLRIFHAGDVSIQILAWHMGGAVVVAMIAAALGRHVGNPRSCGRDRTPRRSGHGLRPRLARTPSSPLTQPYATCATARWSASPSLPDS